MKFNYSTVKNFRNFYGSELKVEWDPGINLILGKNASGKTNLLESLSILSGWGAFTKTSNVISWNDEEKRCVSLYAEVSGEENFDISAKILSKISLRLNNKSISCTDLRLVLPSIIFVAGGANLIDGSPSVRRLFIDRLCALFFPPFAKKLSDFKYVLQNRILLLKQGKPVDRTTDLYCSLGGWIMDRRREVLKLLTDMIPPVRFNMTFRPLIMTSGEEFLREALKRNFNNELRALHPVDGPNYDDLSIILCENKKPVAESLSRGQKKRLILYLIITAGKLIALKIKRNPILLLDDFTAELDSEGKEWTYLQLTKTNWQVFLTSPENPFSIRKKFGGIKF
ncbi:MAG: DNA replication/repair protein RecF [Synergistaceae bacterium]|nr:DNA replication/repair protein RecF [Synergistaceae bacterium]